MQTLGKVVLWILLLFGIRQLIALFGTFHFDDADLLILTLIVAWISACVWGIRKLRTRQQSNSSDQAKQ